MLSYTSFTSVILTLKFGSDIIDIRSFNVDSSGFEINLSFVKF
jgi:hypothetical protein